MSPIMTGTNSDMTVRALAGALAMILAIAVPQMAAARPAAITSENPDSGVDQDDELPYLQCVPFARQSSGIQLYGDALTWWDQAEGRYARGRSPRVGAVMSFRPHGAMTLGHVATVSRIIDPRTVLLRHANWSPIDGRRGQIEKDVRAVDVSPDNDWSEVRVWYAPIGDLGTTHWPVNGFIYNHKPRPGEGVLLASANRTPEHAPERASMLGADFLAGIAPERGTVTPGTMAKPTRALLVAHASAHAAPEHAPARSQLHDDPIGRIIAARMKSQAG